MTAEGFFYRICEVSHTDSLAAFLVLKGKVSASSLSRLVPAKGLN